MMPPQPWHAELTREVSRHMPPEASRQAGCISRGRGLGTRRGAAGFLSGPPCSSFPRTTAAAPCSASPSGAPLTRPWCRSGRTAAEPLPLCLARSCSSTLSSSSTAPSPSPLSAGFEAFTVIQVSVYTTQKSALVMLLRSKDICKVCRLNHPASLESNARKDVSYY